MEFYMGPAGPRVYTGPPKMLVGSAEAVDHAAPGKSLMLPLGSYDRQVSPEPGLPPAFSLAQSHWGLAETSQKGPASTSPFQSGVPSCSGLPGVEHDVMHLN